MVAWSVRPIAASEVGGRWGRVRRGGVVLERVAVRRSSLGCGSAVDVFVRRPQTAPPPFAEVGANRPGTSPRDVWRSAGRGCSGRSARPPGWRRCGWSPSTRRSLDRGRRDGPVRGDRARDSGSFSPPEGWPPHRRVHQPEATEIAPSVDGPYMSVPSLVAHRVVLGVVPQPGDGVSRRCRP